MGVVVAGIVAFWTVVGAFVIVADVGLCLILLVAVVGDGGELGVFLSLVGIGGLTIVCVFLLGIFVAVVGFLVIVGAAVVVGFLLITNSAMWNSHEGHVS